MIPIWKRLLPKLSLPGRAGSRYTPPMRSLQSPLLVAATAVLLVGACADDGSLSVDDVLDSEHGPASGKADEWPKLSNELEIIEHTAKNLLIRAVKTSQPVERWVEQYRKLKSFWGVTPYLERLLRDERLLSP